MPTASQQYKRGRWTSLDYYLQSVETSKQSPTIKSLHIEQQIPPPPITQKKSVIFRVDSTRSNFFIPKRIKKI